MIDKNSDDLLMRGANLWSAKPLLRFEFRRRWKKYQIKCKAAQGRRSPKSGQGA
jgi:hypothetical protein